ncbi:MAG TPA: mechanosensitive ion channel [Flavobacteriaceae bacterium]|jgi:small conductance mechanosensitive channel|nr:mechanosensitive ion channel protein [Flavobacteriaceae bacterium]HBR52905.1 mechanosensitive ion channel protein [Flavobacteriaceae bacterium]HIB47742.1 mechanosensitive ion channel [Flavobacteriaceae bacterium]HIN98801.1 mechanosensitive ion channel [Flavobacteriaceae bacterium]|tara:strand:+ start:5004 stop:5837 length:834 start_codon:yes stop_codon:yes gene_type:complete
MDIFKDTEQILEKYGQKLIDYLPNLVMAIVLLFVGLWIIRLINKFVRKFFAKQNYDVTLEKFIASLINYGLKIVLFVVVVTNLGVESASLVAIIGAAGLAIGLALQGSLSNFAGGVLILLLKPFKVGDFISAQGIDGTVKEISIFNTKLNTFGNQLAFIPNGKLSNDNIINYTEEGLRRENIIFGIGYDDDIKRAKEILLSLVNEQAEVIQLEGKMPMVVVSELGDSSVNLSVRYWANIDDFWNLRFLILEEGKARLEAAGINIPYPQRDVHLYSKN